jgi:glutamyl-Q tRNA(Asp) synthetase
MSSPSNYRGRFAPSPTGPLHFGSLVAAVGSYLDARSRGGEWLVRIEDLDPPREKPGAAAAILRTLEAFGFEWDGEVLYQSDRVGRYREVLAELLTRRTAYLCSCSRKEIADSAVTGIEGPVYPGTCRTGPDPDRPATTLRVRTDDTPIAFQDRIHGKLSQRLASEIGDFIIRRADGLTAYQLAVVVDDADQGVTAVVRGADLLHSTPRQIHLQRLLNLPEPEYAHLPLVLDREGRKLSKQSSSRPVDPANPRPALEAALRFLGQPLPEQSPTELDELWRWAIERWDIGRVPPHNPIDLPW